MSNVNVFFPSNIFLVLVNETAFYSLKTIKVHPSPPLSLSNLHVFILRTKAVLNACCKWAIACTSALFKSSHFSCSAKFLSLRWQMQKSSENIQQKCISLFSLKRFSLSQHIPSLRICRGKRGVCAVSCLDNMSYSKERFDQISLIRCINKMPSCSPTSIQL